MRRILLPWKSLFTRCRECLDWMFVHPDNPDVVYCSCPEHLPPKL